MAAGKRGGLIMLLIGIVSMLAGGAFVIASVMPLMEQFQPVLTMQAPASAEFEVAAPGAYTLWHDHRTFIDGKQVNHDQMPPTDFLYELRRNEDGGTIALEEVPANAQTSMQLQDREAVAIGTFEVAQAGTYSLDIGNAAGDERVFSLTEGNFLGSMTKFGVRLLIGLILGGGGLILLILGIVFMVRGSKARPAGPPPPTTAPPPVTG